MANSINVTKGLAPRAQARGLKQGLFVFGSKSSSIDRELTKSSSSASFSVSQSVDNWREDEEPLQQGQKPASD